MLDDVRCSVRCSVRCPDSCHWLIWKAVHLIHLIPSFFRFFPVQTNECRTELTRVHLRHEGQHHLQFSTGFLWQCSLQPAASWSSEPPNGFGKPQQPHSRRSNSRYSHPPSNINASVGAEAANCGSGALQNKFTPRTINTIISFISFIINIIHIIHMIDNLIIR